MRTYGEWLKAYGTRDGNRQRAEGQGEGADGQLLDEYQSNLETAVSCHSTKFLEILMSRQYAKQVLPEASDKMPSAEAPGGNNLGTMENRSKFVYPLTRAIQHKITGDLTAHPASFEYEPTGHDQNAIDAVEVMETEMARMFSASQNIKRNNDAILHYVESGTIIAQPYTEFPRNMFVVRDSDGERDVPMLEGRLMSYQVYDPLGTLMDPLAKPGSVSETGEWCIISLGLWSKEAIEAKYGVRISYEQESDWSSDYWNKTGTQRTFIVIDSYKRELESDAGLDASYGIMVREYYLKDGTMYVILDDGYIAHRGTNAAGIKGRLPFLWAPMFLDPDSPYGRTLSEEIRPPVEVISTIFNVVCDIAAANARMPFVCFKDMIKRHEWLSESNNWNGLVELDPGKWPTVPGTNFEWDVTKLLSKPRIPGLDQDAQFLIQTALESVWEITGLNPTSLSGFQPKQIRVDAVAQMVSQASLRNSSVIVKNYETYFLNPLAAYFQLVFANYYDDFPAFKAENIDPSVFNDTSAIRICNGSYLPADQQSKQQRAISLAQFGAQLQSWDQKKLLRYVVRSVWGIDARRFDRDPLEMFDEQQIAALLDLLNQQGVDGVMGWLKQMGANMKMLGGGQ